MDLGLIQEIPLPGLETLLLLRAAISNASALLEGSWEEKVKIIHLLQK